MSSLQRLFLDTNIFIIGDANKTSQESVILEALGYRNKTPILKVEIIPAVNFSLIREEDLVRVTLSRTINYYLYD